MSRLRIYSDEERKHRTTAAGARHRKKVREGVQTGDLEALATREKRRQTDREWKRTHRVPGSRVAEGVRYYRKQSVEVLMWRGAKERARTRGLPFDIAVADIVIPINCPIFGTRLVRGKGKGATGPNAPSLDRVISRLGYVVGNVAVISHRANLIKNSGDVDEHLKIAAWIQGYFSRGVSAESCMWQKLEAPK